MTDLTGPRARVHRAEREIVALDRSFQGFFKKNIYEIGLAEYQTKAGHYSLRVKSGPESFPIDWSLCIGEIAHNLRSALDNLAWSLATAYPRRRGPVYQRTAFPVFIVGRTIRLRPGPRTRASIPSFWGKQRGDGTDLIQSIDKSLWARIESFQPYKRGNGGKHGPLHLLSELNNTDKHRLTTVLATGVGMMQVSGLTGGSHFRMRVPLHVNAKVGWVRDVPPHVPGEGGVYQLDEVRMAQWKPGDPLYVVEAKMHVNARVGPVVRFGDTCRAVRRLPVIRTLQGMTEEVSRVIEAFA